MVGPLFRASPSQGVTEYAESGPAIGGGVTDHEIHVLAIETTHTFGSSGGPASVGMGASRDRLGRSIANVTPRTIEKGIGRIAK